MSLLFGKISIYAIVALSFGFGGYMLNDKMQKPVTIPPAPDCICQPPAVSVQPFDVDKIKGLRSFVYSPQFSGSISVAGVDSTALRKMIDKSMDQAFQRYMSNGKRGKRTGLTQQQWEAIAREAKYRTYQKGRLHYEERFRKADEEFSKLTGL